MNVRVISNVSSGGMVFVEVEVTGLVSRLPFVSGWTQSADPIPVDCIDLGDWVAPTDHRHLLLTVPALVGAAPRLSLTDPEAEDPKTVAIEVPTWTFVRRAVNRLMNGPSPLRRIDDERRHGRTRVRVDFIRPKGEALICHAHVSSPEPATMRHLSILDANGRDLGIKPTLLERRLLPTPFDPGEPCEEEEWSFEFPHDERGLVVWAHGTPGGFCSLDKEAVGKIVDKTLESQRDAGVDPSYADWLSWRRATGEVVDEQRAAASTRSDAPLVSMVVVPGSCNADERDASVRSVLAQSYDRLEVVVMAPSLLDGAVVPSWTDDARVRLATSTSSLIGLLSDTEGDVVGLVEGGALLEPDAVHLMVEERVAHSGAVVLYADEDELVDGVLCHPRLKPCYSHDDVLWGDGVGGPLFLSREVVSSLDRTALESGAEHYDLVLRALEQDCEVRHVPRVLLHSLPHAAPAPMAAERALSAHLSRTGVAADVGEGSRRGVLRVSYRLPEPAPLVSVIIPSHDHVDYLRACLTSILSKTTYPDLEVVVVENGSTQPELFSYYDEVRASDERVRLVTWEEPFNYSEVVNFGAASARGDYLLFLNNDTELLSPSWIEEMVGLLQRDEVGVVGAKLWFIDGLVQHAGAVVMPNGAIGHVNQGMTADDRGYLDSLVRPTAFSMVTGACQLVRRSTFEALGGYDERLAVGFNDGEFCLRVREGGQEVVCTPYAELIHREFGTRSREAGDHGLDARWHKEKALFNLLHPDVLVDGDPYVNPNLDVEGLHYRLKW